jgi:prevent-host-death family protein
MPRDYSVAEAKARFSWCVRSAEGGEPIVITRHGKPVAAIVPADDLERLERLRAAGPEAGLSSVAGGWTGSDELARALDRRRRTATRPRRGRT